MLPRNFANPRLFDLTATQGPGMGMWDILQKLRPQPGPQPADVATTPTANSVSPAQYQIPMGDLPIATPLPPSEPTTIQSPLTIPEPRPTTPEPPQTITATTSKTSFAKMPKLNPVATQPRTIKMPSKNVKGYKV